MSRHYIHDFQTGDVVRIVESPSDHPLFADTKGQSGVVAYISNRYIYVLLIGREISIPFTSTELERIGNED